MKNIDGFIKCFEQHVENRLEQSKIKITDLVLEELISFALEDSDNNHVYESGSHTAGRDIRFVDDDEGDKSVKSGKLTDESLTISSFRLSRYKDLKDMLNFIDNDGKNFDFYYVLGRKETRDVINYVFYMIPSDIFTSTKMKWEDTYSTRSGKHSGWKTIDDSPIKLKIVDNMSSQLWIDIDRKFVDKFKYFEIKKDLSKLGEKRFIAIL